MGLATHQQCRNKLPHTWIATKNIPSLDHSTPTLHTTPLPPQLTLDSVTAYPLRKFDNSPEMQSDYYIHNTIPSSLVYLYMKDSSKTIPGTQSLPTSHKLLHLLTLSMDQEWHCHLRKTNNSC